MSPIEDFISLYSANGTRSAYKAALFNFMTHCYNFHREKRNATPEEIARYEELAAQYVQEVKAEERDPVHDLQRFIVFLREKNMAAKTQGNNVAGVCEWMAHNKIRIERDDLKRVRRRLPKDRPVTQEEIITRETIAKILAHLDIRGRAAVLVLASSGVRIGELLLLEDRDIDLSSTPARVHLRPEITKSKEARDTFISEEAKETLIEWLRVREDYHSRARSKGAGLSLRYRDNDPRVFQTSKTNFHYFWDRAVIKAGLFSRDERTRLNKVRVHGLRKFFRTNMALKIPADVVEAFIGHADGLELAYRRFTIEQLSEQYERGMEMVTINTGDPAVRQEVKTLREQNKELQERLEELEKMNRVVEASTAAFMRDPEKLRRLDKFLAQLTD